MLSRAITPARAAILEALIGGPKSLGELQTLLGRQKPTLLRHLRLLEEEGIVRKETVITRTGRLVRYHLRPYTLLLRVDPDAGAVLRFEASEAVDLRFPLLGQIPQEEFRRDVAAYLGAVAAACRDWARPPWIVLFGSAARGEGTWKSDIDVLILFEAEPSSAGTERRPAPGREKVLRRALAGAAGDAAHLLKPHFATVDAFLAKDEGVLRAAKEDGIVVWGEATGGTVWRALTRYRSISG